MTKAETEKKIKKAQKQPSKQKQMGVQEFGRWFRKSWDEWCGGQR